jgi:hypothetical protein
MHEYLLHDLAHATLAEHRHRANQHRLARGAAPRRRAGGRPGSIARLLAHLRLRPAPQLRRSEPAGA